MIGRGEVGRWLVCSSPQSGVEGKGQKGCAQVASEIVFFHLIFTLSHKHITKKKHNGDSKIVPPVFKMQILQFFNKPVLKH